MGRIAHGPLFALRETKPWGLRGLGHPISEVYDGLRLGSSERGGRSGLRMGDVRGPGWQSLLTGPSICGTSMQKSSSEGGMFAFAPTRLFFCLRARVVHV
jgi:hypothetical protein